jgi:hypothetical protein
MISPDIFDALQPVVSAFERLGVAYHIGGSVASSAYGFARSTIDVDIVADLRPEHIEPLVEELQAAYYIDPIMIEDAIRRRSSFNVIHEETIVKVDVFIAKTEAFDQEVFGRVRERRLASDKGVGLFLVVSPEDLILRKLEWYKAGGEVSERQWGDVVGVLKVQGKGLDWAYLRQWAGHLGLSDLLERAMGEAGNVP